MRTRTAQELRSRNLIVCVRSAGTTRWRSKCGRESHETARTSTRPGSGQTAGAVVVGSGSRAVGDGGEKTSPRGGGRRRSGWRSKGILARSCGGGERGCKLNNPSGFRPGCRRRRRRRRSPARSSRGVKNRPTGGDTHKTLPHRNKQKRKRCVDVCASDRTTRQPLTNTKRAVPFLNVPLSRTHTHVLISLFRRRLSFSHV